jgi:mRNA-degrading endonuclease RelE of RelBE toxin-antitoxin system
LSHHTEAKPVRPEQDRVVRDMPGGLGIDQAPDWDHNSDHHDAATVHDGFANEVKEHLRAIERKHHSRIRETIDEQLRFEPDRATRNRKPLKPPAPFEAGWELRCGPDNRFRVFYDLDLENREVEILAIGMKERNRVLIGGEEVDS